MEIAIIGKKYTGKTTIFNLLTGMNVDHYSKENHEGMAEVPDERIDKLFDIYQPAKKVYAKFKVIDMPGVSKDKFYSSSYMSGFKNTDALIYVIRTFNNEEVPFDEKIDPINEIKQFEEEIIISDLAITEARLEKLTNKMKKRKDKNDEDEFKLLEKIKTHLDNMKPIREMELHEDEKKIIRGFTFLSQKPILYILNIDENEISLQEKIIDKYSLSQIIDPFHKVSFICAKVEKELDDLDNEEKIDFMNDYGIKIEAKKRILKEAFSLLNLICFLTAGKDEVRAWPIKKGTKAKQAAGTIHSDIERGFIKAEVFHYNDLIKHNNEHKLKELNLIRLEGKEYIVKDGDIINFRFNI